MKSQRIQRKRTKGWKMPKNTVYVGRPSKWGNPYRVGDLAYGTELGSGLTSPRSIYDALRMHAEMLANLRHNDPDYFEHWIAPLRGKNLACWCKKGEPCHADILLKLANEEKK